MVKNCMYHVGQRPKYTRTKAGAFAQRGPISDGLSAQQYVRKQFLEMYKQNTVYFTNTPSTKAYWETLGVDFADQSKLPSVHLSEWLNSKSESASFLNFIVVK